MRYVKCVNGELCVCIVKTACERSGVCDGGCERLRPE